MYRLIFVIAVGILPMMRVNSQAVNNVDSKTFSSLIASEEGIILDVRTPREYSRGHIESSTLISTNDPKFVEKVSLLQKEKPIYVYCLTGSRSYAVANYLSKNGYSKVYNLRKGILEWQRYGYPIAQSDNPAASDSKTYSVSEFNKLLYSDNLVLIDFHAPWCAPCKKMSPIVESVQKDYTGKLAVRKIDVQANKTLQTTYNVQSIPGLILFKNGKEVWKHAGVISREELSRVIKQYL